MIVDPRNWSDIGTPITIEKVEEKIKETIGDAFCNYLALSGGLDSSLLLYFMVQEYGAVEAFTIGSSEEHPDVKYARFMVEHFSEEVVHRVYIPTKEEIRGEPDYGKDVKGDKATRLFYRFVRKYTDRIISGDGADEFMAGYYDHQNHPNEVTYYGHIRQLQKRQLVPLNGNSGNVRVYLPYLDKSLLYLLCQIPLTEKVNENERKILMVKMARGKIPDSIIRRRKIGFCDVLKIKE